MFLYTDRTERGVWYTEKFATDKTEWQPWDQGLDPAWLPFLSDFDISISGRGFLQVGDQMVLSSPAPGSPWTVVLNKDMLDDIYQAAFPPAGLDPSITTYIRGNAYITCFAINRMADDELMIFAGHGRAVYYEAIEANFFFGSSGGVTKALSWSTTHHDWTGGGSLIHTDTGWVLYSGAGPDNAWLTRVSPDGSSLVSKVAYGYYLGYIFGQGVSQTFVLYSGGDPLYQITSDGGASFTNVPNPPVPYGNKLDMLQLDSTGSYMMMAVNAFVAEKSTDGGTTWLSAGLSGEYTSFWCYGDKDHWLASGGTSLRYTVDFGVTWIDVTGNLGEFLGLAWTAIRIRSL